MKLLFDLFPVILFFVAFKLSEKDPAAAAALVGQLLGSGAVAQSQAPILVATVVVMLATAAQIGWVWFRHGRVDRMLWISLVLVVVFGGLTLIFQDETFIKWKPTLLYWIFAGSMAFAAAVLKKNAIRAMLGEQIQLPEPVWMRLNLSWMAFFVLMGALNLFVAFNFSTDTWVNFKLFGGMGLMLVFVLAQGVFLSRYMEDKS
ncbi:MAG TPA: septation protein A [Rhodocyclaceae bacterium]|jgi:intracellular septation protein|nr:septation protein A [Betaproteobacteria bacterium]HMV00825.1 septation protein A [Rhodocyclaceae bacterium]HMV20488.1 septation protein A [Rhodocyclaceae bacterium]HMW77434.1 septation protein A [Rhodocyclaceae bacterium]HNE43253.1 septation protein A [Rhodocyclaceae bacterium]